MKVLITGGAKGTWQMRGHQLGAAIGARVRAKPQPHDWAWADLVVLVKRGAEAWFRDAQRAGVPLVWDVLDVWRQPSMNQRPEADLVREVGQLAASLRVRQVIGATRAMAAAIGGVYLPHHHRLGLAPAPIRDALAVVAYEGSPRYLGSWRRTIEDACARLGLAFVVNPPDLTAADVVVAFRGEEWDGPICRQWKSGVKYVNAIAAGRPVVTQACAAFTEIAPAGLVVEDPADLVEALAALRSPEVRQVAYEQGLRRAGAFAIDRMARAYRAILDGVYRSAAA